MANPAAPSGQPPFAVTRRPPPYGFLPPLDTPAAPDPVAYRNPVAVQDAQLAFDEAEERYAWNTAERRSDDAELLLAGNGLHRWLRQHVTSRRRYAQAQEQYEEGIAAREEYRQALDDLLEARGVRADLRGRAMRSVMHDFENHVLDAQDAVALSNLRSGNRLQRWQERMRLRVASAWFDANKGGRAAMIAVPAAVLGVGVGVATVAVSAPALAVVGIGLGVAAAGKGIGGYIAHAANRYQSATDNGTVTLEERATNRYADYRDATRYTSDDLDVTEWYERGTEHELADKSRRSQLAKGLGALAAGVGFGVAYGVAHNMQSVHQLTSQQSSTHLRPTATHEPLPTQTPTPPHVPPTHVTPPPPANLTHEYAWNAATQYNTAHHIPTDPSHIWHTLNHAASQWNAAHAGSHFQYVHHANNTFWLQNGPTQLTPTQYGNFNTFLWNMTA